MADSVNLAPVYVALALQTSGLTDSHEDAEKMAELLERSDAASGAARQLGGIFRDLYNEGRDVFWQTFAKIRPFLCDGIAPKLGVVLSTETVFTVAETFAHTSGVNFGVGVLCLKICIIVGHHRVCSATPHEF